MLWTCFSLAVMGQLDIFDGKMDVLIFQIIKEWPKTNQTSRATTWTSQRLELKELEN